MRRTRDVETRACQDRGARAQTISPAYEIKTRLVALVAIVAATMASAVATPAGATPALVVDAATGDVLYQDEATRPWYPASLTKLMTVYVALAAVRDHRIALDTPLVVSARAASMPPSKMGFVPGTEVTLDNALKMLMVRSANDLAITVAEGVSGSVEAFADDMNAAAASLGLRESHFANPNGLPNPDHVSSARDMAIIARALYNSFPEQAPLFDLGALALGGEIITNHNNMLGRYPGVDGMKTGFTCSAGFNVVLSAYRDGRRLIAVVLGAPTVAARSAKAAALLDRGFAGIDHPIASIVALPAANTSGPPDMRNQVCHNRAPLIARFNSEVEALDAPLIPAGMPTALPTRTQGRALLASYGATGRPPAMATVINAMPPPSFQPVAVHIGPEPGYAGVVAQARPPHSPIGTEPDPVAAIAYAPPLATTGLAGSPLKVDATALPLRGRGRLARVPRLPRKPAVKAAGIAKPQARNDVEEGAGAAGEKEPAARAAKATPVKPAPAKVAATAKKTKLALVAPPKKPAVKPKSPPVKPAAAKPKPDSATE